MSEVTDKETPDTYIEDLFTLKVLYGRVVAILDAKVANGIVIDDQQLSAVYLFVLDRIDKILAKPAFRLLKSDMPEIYGALKDGPLSD